MAKEAKSIRVRVEAVLLSVVDGQLCVAARRRAKKPCAGSWSLPGGAIRPSRDVDAAAAIERVLRRKAGLIGRIRLEQLATHGTSRDPRGWSMSIVFYGLVPGGTIGGQAQAGQAALAWLPVAGITEMAFDHRRLLFSAVEQVRANADFSPWPLVLMPEQFTLSQLQTVYQQLLAGSLDKRGFRRRIEHLEALEPLTGQFAGGVQRPAQLFRVRASLRNDLFKAPRA